MCYPTAVGPPQKLGSLWFFTVSALPWKPLCFKIPGDLMIGETCCFTAYSVKEHMMLWGNFAAVCYVLDV